MEIIVDRIEEEIAVIELPNGEIISVPKKIFGNVKENDVIDIKINEEKTNQKKLENQKKLNELFEEK